MKVVIFLALFALAAEASPFESRVIQGVDAIPNSAPYIVSLSQTPGGSHYCAGSLIAKQWVITAAHCATNPIGVGVLAGLHVRGALDEKTQARIVDFGIQHKLYGTARHAYDIAILHVSEPFVLTPYVQTVALPFRRETPAGNVGLYGWGKKSANAILAAKTLQYVETEIIEWEECRALMPENSAVDERMVCSGSFDAGISACNGDSGGPLVKETEGATAELVGIVSWGYVPCGEMNFPSVYTQVSLYLDWITTIMHSYYVLN